MDPNNNRRNAVWSAGEFIGQSEVVASEHGQK